MVWLYIAAGGAAGALARYGLSGWIQARAGIAFPWGTFLVNALGSLLIGFALRYMEAARFTSDVRALIAIGLLGSFTTFSTFSYETVTLLQEGAWTRAAAYAGGSLLLGVAAVIAGAMLAGPLLHARG